MSILYLENALAVGSAKEAALYFDTVVPLDLIAGATARENLHSIIAQRNPEKIIKSLLPAVDDAMSFYRGHVGIAEAFWSLVALRKFHSETGSCSPFFQQDSRYVNESRRLVRLIFQEDLDAIAKDIESGRHQPVKYRERCNQMFDNGLNGIGFQTYSIWHDPHYSSTAVVATRQETLSPETVSLVLQGIDFIDADKLSWGKILAIRSDGRALSELRALRLFLHDNFVGVEREAALQKIHACIDRYNTQVKTLRLETVKKSLSMVVSKEGLGLTALGALATFAITGVPVDPASAAAAIVAAVKSGAALNFGGGTLVQFLDAKIRRSKLDVAPDSNIKYLQSLARA